MMKITKEFVYVVDMTRSVPLALACSLLARGFFFWSCFASQDPLYSEEQHTDYSTWKHLTNTVSILPPSYSTTAAPWRVPTQLLGE